MRVRRGLGSCEPRAVWAHPSLRHLANAASHQRFGADPCGRVINVAEWCPVRAQIQVSMEAPPSLEEFARFQIPALRHDADRLAAWIEGHAANEEVLAIAHR